MKRYVQKLFSWHGDIYDTEGSDELFWNAIRENRDFHLRHNPAYRKLSQRFSHDHEPLPIPAAFFKVHPLRTMKPASLPFHVTSSGTSGRKTDLCFTFSDMARGARLTYAMVRRHKILSARPSICLIMSFEPGPGPRTMVSRTQAITSFFAPPVRRIYALTLKDGRYRLNISQLIHALVLAERLKLPVRILGFPSYTYFFLEGLRKRKLRFLLPDDSMLLLGGGWKGFENMKPEKGRLIQLTEEVLGISPQQYREFFGAAEHPSLYCGCGNMHFHVPVYSRILIRDVHSLKPLPYGKP